MAGRIIGSCAGFCCMVSDRSAGGFETRYLLTHISLGFNIGPYLMEHHQVGYAIIYATLFYIAATCFCVII